MERLQKLIAQSGYCSRRKAEELIKQGQVFVDGKKIDKLGTQVLETADIKIGNVHLNQEKKEYYLLNKPRGVISSVKDEKGRKTVIDFIDTKARIYPVGRLDYDTTGLIILTNDGALANKLMHPSFKTAKTYIAKLNKVLEIADLYKIKKGITIDGRKVDVEKVKIKSKNISSNTCLVEITIIEGRNHIVKKIFSSLGYDVIRLHRQSYDFLTLNNLKSGEYRELSLKEVKKLYR